MGLKGYQKDYCEGLIHSLAIVSGGANLVPIPGLGIVADIETMVGLGIALNKYFQEEIEEAIKNSITKVERMSIAKQSSNFETTQTICFGISATSFLIGTNIAESVIKDLAIQVIKETASKSVAKELVKFVPIIGQLVAPTMSIAMLEVAGWSLANKLHDKVYKEAINRLDEYCDEEDVPPYIRDKIAKEINKEYNGDIKKSQEMDDDLRDWENFKID